jgi:hypothetical protein
MQVKPIHLLLTMRVDSDPFERNLMSVQLPVLVNRLM